MANGFESAQYEIKLKDSFTGPLSNADKKFTSFEDKVKKFGDSSGGAGGSGGFNMALGGMARSALRMAGALGLTFGAAGIIKGVVSLGAEMEQTRVTFETMLGSADAAAKFITDIEKTAAATPFDSITLQNQAKLLLNFGASAESIIPSLTMLGDVSGGNKARFEGLTLAYAQVRSQGRLMGQDLLQMINAGFNPLQAISEKTGKSMAVLKKEMEKGGITFAMVEGAFKDVTSEGGRFFNLMAKQSQTLSGRWSTLVDNTQRLGTKIGTSLLPSLGKTVDFFAELLNQFRPLSERFKEQHEAFGKTQSSLDGMLKEYDKLKSKGELTADEQERLNKLIQEVSNIVPSAVTQWDAYGNALDINKEKIKDFTKLNRDAMSLMNQKAIKEQQGELLTLANRALVLKETLQRGGEEKFFGGTGGGRSVFTPLGEEARREKASEFRGIGAQNTGLIAKTFEELKSLGAMDVSKEAAAVLKKLGYEIPNLLEEANGDKKVPGVIDTKTGAGGTSATAAGVEKISGGGIKNITVNVTKLVETINFNQQKFEQGSAAMVEEVKRALLTALNDVNIVTN